MTTNPITDLVSRPLADTTREARSSYLVRRDALLASGAFVIEDLRKTQPPTGQRYAE